MSKVRSWCLVSLVATALLVVLCAGAAAAAPPPPPPPPPAPPIAPTAAPPRPSPQASSPVPTPVLAGATSAAVQPPTKTTEAPAPAAASPGPSSAPTEKPSLDIRAKSSTIDRKANTFLWEGEVKALYGDITMTCERFEGSYDPETQEPTRMAAAGNVTMDAPQWHATCARAEYDPKAEIAQFFCSEQVRARLLQKQKGIITEADELTYKVKEDFVTGTNVRTIIPTTE